MRFISLLFALTLLTGCYARFSVDFLINDEYVPESKMHVAWNEQESEGIPIWDIPFGVKI